MRITNFGCSLHVFSATTWLLIALLGGGSAHAAGSAEIDAGKQPETDLFLAGGALNICGSLALQHCQKNVQFSPGRSAARYRLDAPGIASASSEILWKSAPLGRAEELHVWLTASAKKTGEKSLTEAQLIDALDAACTRHQGLSACEPTSLWQRLSDHERGSILAALEQPQLAPNGERLREQVSLKEGRDSFGADIMRAFVAAAAERAEARPNVAIVTASGFDSMDAVDYYLAALREAGAEPRWWPIDAAAAAIVFTNGDCANLDASRVAILGVSGRARIYPDHAATQAAWCERDDANVLPTDLHGVFFAGGDQWRLRQALVDANDAPNRWLIDLRAAFASGRLVVGGTSAGSAVQSTRAMIGNGTAAYAMRQGGKPSAPPLAGCARSGQCGRDEEDAFRWWPSGGIGLAPMVVDTHFSERSREWRLLRLLASSGERAALGVDETSALQLTGRADGSLQIKALGRSGGWLFTAEQSNCTSLSGTVHYLAAGNQLSWRDGAVLLPPLAAGLAAVAEAETRVLPIEQSLQSAAVRTALQALVPLDAGPVEFADATTALRLLRTSQTRAYRGTGALRSVLGAGVEARWPAADCGPTSSP